MKAQKNYAEIVSQTAKETIVNFQGYDYTINHDLPKHYFKTEKQAGLWIKSVLDDIDTYPKIDNRIEIETALWNRIGAFVTAYMAKIKNVKQGDFFLLTFYGEPDEKRVYIRDGYDRTERKYVAHKFSDINSELWLKGDRMVYVHGFRF